jgi:hypothetical protein
VVESNWRPHGLQRDSGWIEEPCFRREIRDPKTTRPRAHGSYLDVSGIVSKTAVTCIAGRMAGGLEIVFLQVLLGHELAVAGGTGNARVTLAHMLRGYFSSVRAFNVIKY